MPTSASVEEYLEAIYKLEQREHPVRISKLAAALKVAPSSATEMTKRLSAQGLVNRCEGSGICLTGEGREEALKTVRRHRLVERFLTDTLGLPWDRVHDEACRLEHALSDEVEQGLDRFLGNPATCPHGFPIPSADGEVYMREDTSLLVDLPAGARARVVAVEEEDPEMLSYLGSLGLLPGVSVFVAEVAPFGGPLLVEVRGAKYALGPQVASKITVIAHEDSLPGRPDGRRVRRRRRRN